MKIKRILIVEDEKLLCEFYNIIFSQIAEERLDFKFNISIHKTFDSAYLKINNEIKKQIFDLALLDIRLKDRLNNVTKDGTEIGIQLRRVMPETKIIFFTSVPSHRKFHHILTKVNPEGLWVKDEILDVESVKRSLTDVLEGGTSYGPNATKFLKDKIADRLELNQVDRDILFYLSKGIKNKNLPEFLNLSMSSIEKRKQNILKILEIDSSNDAELISKARKMEIIS